MKNMGWRSKSKIFKGYQPMGRVAKLDSGELLKAGWTASKGVCNADSQQVWAGW